MDLNEARSQWEAMKGDIAGRGLILPQAQMFTPDAWKQGDYTLEQMAMDAGIGPAGFLTTDPNSALPTILTTTVDPEVVRIVFAELKMAKIMGGERKVGDWLDEQRIFPVVEETGEVSSYDDYSNNGRAGINFNFPWFQSYLYQTIIGYGDREAARAGLMRINYVSELNTAAANMLNRFQNLSYAFGIQGLQNYGLFNNPYLSATITPTVKAWGGVGWFNNGAPAATANEVYNDVLALWTQLIALTNGTVDMEAKANNPGFSPVGNLVQLIVDKIEGQEVAYPAYNEKMRAHKMVPELSSWKQKMTAGTWGTIIRIPMGIVGMIGI
jgi:hypothetical protein